MDFNHGLTCSIQFLNVEVVRRKGDGARGEGRGAKRSQSSRSFRSGTVEAEIALRRQRFNGIAWAAIDHSPGQSTGPELSPRFSVRSMSSESEPASYVLGFPRLNRPGLVA